MLSKQDEKVFRLAEKGGRDAELFLLTQIHEVEEDLDTHKKEMSEAFGELENKIDETVKELKENLPDLDNVLESIRGRDGKDGLDSMIPGPQGLKGDKGDSIIGRQGPRGERGEMGKQGNPGKDGESIIGPAGKDGLNGSDTPQEIRNKLQTLKGDERLDVKYIKGIEEEIKSLRTLLTNIPRGKAMGRVKVPMIKRFRLTDQVNGTARTFTLPPDTVDIVALIGSQFPFTADDNDWELVGGTLRLAGNMPTPESGQTLIAIIETLFYG